MTRVQRAELENEYIELLAEKTRRRGLHATANTKAEREEMEKKYPRIDDRLRVLDALLTQSEEDN
jgi:hypothetical protein